MRYGQVTENGLWVVFRLVTSAIRAGISPAPLTPGRLRGDLFVFIPTGTVVTLLRSRAARTLSLSSQQHKCSHLSARGKLATKSLALPTTSRGSVPQALRVVSMPTVRLLCFELPSSLVSHIGCKSLMGLRMNEHSPGFLSREAPTELYRCTLSLLSPTQREITLGDVLLVGPMHLL